MSETEMAERLEVQIPEDMLKDLVEPGKTFQRDIPIDEDESKKSERPRIGLRLEKMADSLVKIFITILKQDDLSNTSMQTDKVVTEHISSQTDVKKTGTSVSQTDKNGTEESAIQTDKKQEKTQQQQTDKKQEKTQQQQTEDKAGTHKQQQTENTTGNHKQQQTDPKEEKHQQQQTNRTEYKDSTCQTETKVFVSTECQTKAKSIVEQDCQTDIAEVKSHLVQTDMSLANLVDGCTQHEVEFNSTSAQASVEVGECEVQATVVSIDSVVQTVIDTKTTAAQAVADMGAVLLQTEMSFFNYTEMCCQTELDLTTQDCQTDFSIANLQESEVQAVVSNSEVGQQTELEQRMVCIQTEFLGHNIDTQTVVDLTSTEVQTDTAETMPNIQEDQKEAQPPILEDTMEGPPNITGDNQHNPVPGDIAAPLVDQGSANLCESGSQTDPVTIIIGDASFLVQKLKSASVNPAKVSGNEIEIEVGEGSDVTQNGGPETYSNSPRTPQQQVIGQKLRTAPVTAQLPITSPPVNSPQPPKRIKGRPKQHIISQGQIDVQKQQVVGVKQGFVPKPIDVVAASFSCPFCEMTFLESGTLYEHITINHNDAMVKGHKKPKGREGKTIVPRSSPAVGIQQQLASPPYLVPQGMATVVSKDQYGQVVHEQVLEQVEAIPQDAEAEPPVLEPMYVLQKQTQNTPKAAATPKQKAAKTYSRTAQPQPSLFEDLPQPNRTHPRNRVKREGNEGDDDEDQIPQPQIDAYEYECPHCPEKYGSASHLYTHLKRSHRTDLEKNKEPLAHTSDGDGASLQSSEDGGTSAKKRKRISAVATNAETDVVKKQRMSEEIEGADGEEMVNQQEEFPGPGEEGSADEEIPTESEMQEAAGVGVQDTDEKAIMDEVAQEALEAMQDPTAEKILPVIKAPARKPKAKAATASPGTPTQPKRRGRPPKSAKSPAVTGESSPKVTPKNKRT